jgi:hypothetical protein
MVHLLVGVFLFHEVVGNGKSSKRSLPDDDWGASNSDAAESAPLGGKTTSQDQDEEPRYHKYSRRSTTHEFEQLAQASTQELSEKYGRAHSLPGCFSSSRASPVHFIIDMMNRTDAEKQKVMEVRFCTP